MARIVDFEEVAETLVDNGATYVAANKQSLVDEPVQIYYHLPAGVSDGDKETIQTYLAEQVGHRPHDHQIGVARIADQQSSIRVFHVLHDDLHLYRRVPVYVANGVVGLDSVTLEEGITNAENIVANQPDVAPRATETAALEDVVEKLAEAGAATVELAHEFLISEEPIIQLRIPMVPAEGKPILGPIDSVEFAGETYPLRTTLTLNGPYGSAPGWTALYVGDEIIGLKPVPVEEGVEQGRRLLARAADAEMLQDLEPPNEY